MKSTRRLQRGYSMAELITVVAIIGIMSLVTIPAFMNYSKSARLKTSLRQFTGDLRATRAQAVTRTIWMQVAVTSAAGTAPGRYEIRESNDRGATFTAIRSKELDNRNFFDVAESFTFLPNGTATFAGAVPTMSLKVKSNDTAIKNEYTVTVNTGGKISTQ